MWARLGLLAALGCVAACTDYRPVQMAGNETWLEARNQAEVAARARAGTSLVDIDSSGRTRHVVMPGESVSLLAKKYGVSQTALIDANRLPRPYRIYVGQVMAIPLPAPVPVAAPTLVAQAPQRVRAPKNSPASAPARPTPGRSSAPPTPEAAPPAGAVTVASLGPMAPPAARPVAAVAAPPSPMPAEIVTPVSAETQREASEATPPALSGKGFLWPLSGQLVGRFGAKPNGQRNDGINIAAPAGTPVRAAENGIVVYAGAQIAGFGNMLILRHAGGFITTYAHNQRLEVGVGDKVRRGQVIALVGATGTVQTSQLHFELREGTRPIDPQGHLVDPQRQVASTGSG